MHRWIGLALVVALGIGAAGCSEAETKTPKAESKGGELKSLPVPGAPGGGGTSKNNKAGAGSKAE